jgi:hypothetical protein
LFLVFYNPDDVRQSISYYSSVQYFDRIFERRF